MARAEWNGRVIEEPGALTYLVGRTPVDECETEIAVTFDEIGFDFDHFTEFLNRRIQIVARHKRLRHRLMAEADADQLGPPSGLPQKADQPGDPRQVVVHPRG